MSKRDEWHEWHEKNGQEGGAVKTIFTFCMCCGLHDGRHKKGCAQYRKMLNAMFGGDVRKLFAASDNGLLPPPPWAGESKDSDDET